VWPARDGRTGRLELDQERQDGSSGSIIPLMSLGVRANEAQFWKMTVSPE
jgi:hypothetical protein